MTPSGVHRFCVAEFEGGPWDGKREVMEWPAPERITVGAPPAFECWRDPRAEFESPNVHHYVLVRTPDGVDLLAVTDEMLAQSRIAIPEYHAPGMASIMYKIERPHA